VNSYRGPTIVAIFFLLISFGQAYSLAYAWANSSRLECSCNRGGHPCQHGCELKKNRHCHAPSSSWVNPGCSKQNGKTSIDFQADPFMPERIELALATRYFSADLNSDFFALHWRSSPESPPPKTC